MDNNEIITHELRKSLILSLKSPGLRVLMAEGTSPWIVHVCRLSGLQTIQDLRDEVDNAVFWDDVVAVQSDLPPALTRGRIEEARAVIRKMKEGDDPGNPNPVEIEEIQNSQRNFSLSQQELEEQKLESAAEEALRLIGRMGTSSWMAEKVLDGTWTPEKAKNAIIVGKKTILSGPHILARVNALKGYEEWCKQNQIAAWFSVQNGPLEYGHLPGPSIEVLESYAEFVFREIEQRAAAKPEKTRTGHSKVNSFLQALSWAQGNLGLKYVPQDQNIIRATSAKLTKKYGKLPDQAKPWSDSVLMLMEAIAAGEEPRASGPDRFFAGICLVAAYASRRFSDIQHICSDHIGSVGLGESFSGWRDKTSQFEHRWVSITSSDWLYTQWTEPWKRTAPEGKRDHFCPLPARGYQSWHVGTKEDPQRALSTTEAETWLKRLMGLPLAARKLTETERKEILARPRIHAGRRTLPTMVAASGGGVEEVQLLTGHRSQESAKRYINEQQVLAQNIRAQAFEPVRQNLGVRNPLNPAARENQHKKLMVRIQGLAQPNPLAKSGLKGIKDARLEGKAQKNLVTQPKKKKKRVIRSDDESE